MIPLQECPILPSQDNMHAKPITFDALSFRPALWNDSPPALRSVMLPGISSASLRSLKTFIFTSLSR